MGIFPDDDSAIRLVGGVLVDQHDEWQATERRYLSGGSMAQIEAPPMKVTTSPTPNELNAAQPRGTHRGVTPSLPPHPGTRSGELVDVDPATAPVDPGTVLEAILGRRPDGGCCNPGSAPGLGAGESPPPSAMPAARSSFSGAMPLSPGGRQHRSQHTSRGSSRGRVGRRSPAPPAPRRRGSGWLHRSRSGRR